MFLQLKVREHPVMGPYVEDLTKVPVQSYDDVQGWLQLGNKQRATATTGMNDKSSRSHSVFTLVLTQSTVCMICLTFKPDIACVKGILVIIINSRLISYIVSNITVNFIF